VASNNEARHIFQIHAQKRLKNIHKNRGARFFHDAKYSNFAVHLAAPNAGRFFPIKQLNLIKKLYADDWRSAMLGGEQLMEKRFPRAM
jgi:hypothetical protein